MDLRNTLPHKANTKVLVDGTVYDIDADGIVRDIPDAAAEKLLQNPVWSKDTDVQKPKPKPKTPQRAVLLDENDDPVEGQEPPATDAEVAAAVEEHEEAAQDPDVDGNAAAGEEEAEEEADEAGDEEWPDPTEDMDIEYLHQMADAYEVKYNKNLGKAKLVERIREAMYPDE